MTMHVAMIIDRERLMREHTMLRRLAIGLMGRGVRLTRIIPDDIQAESILASEKRIALVPRIEVPMKVLPWMRASRAADLASQMDRALPDVIYAVGQGAWGVAADLAESIECPIAMDIWSAELAEKAPRNRAAENIGCYIAPTAPIAGLLRRRVDPYLVSLVPMGVAIPSGPPSAFSQHPRSVTAAIIGSGRDLAAYRGLLRALKDVLGELPQLQMVIELRGRHEHDIWKEMKQLDLLHVISPIQDASLHRSLITRCDAVIMPESYGQPRSLLLQCMAASMLIIARHDPMLDMLEHDQNAILLDAQDMDRWPSQLRSCLGDIEYAHALGEGARIYAARHHSSHLQISGLLETFQRMVSGENYVFASQEALGNFPA